MIERKLRQHLEDLSDDIPDLDAMRERVRSRIDETQPLSQDRGGGRGRGRVTLVAFGTAASLALIVLAWRPLDTSETTDVAAERPIVVFEMPPGPWEGSNFASLGLEPELGLVLPAGTGMPQTLDGHHLAIPLVDDEPSTLHVLFPVDTSVEEAEQAIRSSASDTTVTLSEAVAVGDRVGRRLLLVSDRGTSQVAYQVGFATYLRVSGVDRRHEILVLPVDPARPEQSFVIWIELPEEGGELARTIAVEIIASLRL